MSRTSIGRAIVAVMVSSLGFCLMVVLTDGLVSSVATSSSARNPAYLVFDLTNRCLYLIAAGYVCSVIARSPRLAVAFLMVLGLSVGTFSFSTSEPHWYGIALLATYAPCLGTGWALGRGPIDEN